MPLMAGRQAFLEILRAAGVEYIIENPGITELPLMDVLPDHPDFKYILTLQEGVAMATNRKNKETIASLPGFGMAPVGHLSYRAAPNMRVGRTPPCAVQVHIDPILP